MEINYTEEMYEDLLKKYTFSETKLNLANYKVKQLKNEVEKYKKALTDLSKANAVLNDEYNRVKEIHEYEIQEAVYEVLRDTIKYHGMLERIIKEVKENEQC